MTRLSAILLVLIACARTDKSDKSGDTHGPRGPNFELHCESLDGKASAELVCVRHDTRNGEVMRIAHTHIMVSQGPTKAAENGPPGRYQLACRSTRTEESSLLYCLRLNTENGELLMVQLPKVGVIPAEAARHEHGSGVHSH